MTSKIRNMLDYYIVRKEHHKFRQEEKDPYRYAADYAEKGLGDLERSDADCGMYSRKRCPL